MMRRLASQTRDDAYNSQRDYQTLVEGQGLRFTVENGKFPAIKFTTGPLEVASSARFAAFGCFLRSSADLALQATLTLNGSSRSIELSIDLNWRRFGLAIPVVDSGEGEVVLALASTTGFEIDVWGLNAGILELPASIDQAVESVADLNQKHLVPETFYLDQAGACALEVVPVENAVESGSSGSTVTLKKCSYCGRMLPLDPDRLGALSFHKHLAKKTNHQNECRSCKKWRINDGFNPLRTTDQLHESSVITRERKVFLRESEILQLIKERSGAGLKSQVWERFGRKCFNCGRDLEVHEVQLDHTRPLAYLWPIDEHATCLCAECNNWKKDKFPSQFYTPTQLRALAHISGLEYYKLAAVEVNAVELHRIVANIVEFSREWDPRTFAATSRRIASVLPDVDLLEELRRRNPKAYEDLKVRLADRPLPVEDFDSSSREE